MNYKSFLAVETYDTLMATQNIIFLEILMQGFDNLFGYNFQEIPKLKLLNINIIQSDYGNIIGQTDNIIKSIIYKYWEKKTKYEVNFQKSPFPVDTSF